MVSDQPGRWRIGSRLATAERRSTKFPPAHAPAPRGPGAGRRLRRRHRRRPRPVDHAMDQNTPPVQAQRPNGIALRLAVIAVYLVINGIVFYNARKHDPGIGYDSDAHLHYLMTLAQGRLPAREDTG